MATMSDDRLALLVPASGSGAKRARRGGTAEHQRVSDRAEESLASVLKAYTVCATFWLLFATGVGLLLAFKFGAPDFWGGAWLTFGRLRPIHTNATFYGFASLALVGMSYYVAARSNGTRLYS